RFFEPNERIHQAALRELAWSGWIFEEISQVVAGGEHVSSAVPEDNTDFFVFVGLVEDIRQARVHGCGEGVLLLRAIDFDPQDAAGTLSVDVAHRLPRWLDVFRLARPRVPWLSARLRLCAGPRCPSCQIPAPGEPRRCARRGRERAAPALWR